MTQTPSTRLFSFDSRYRNGHAMPTFDLPGWVCGAIHVDREQAQNMQVVKITLKGILQTSVTFGVSSTGLAQMRCLEQTFLELVDTHTNIRSINGGENDQSLTIPFAFHVPKPRPQDRVGESSQIPCYPPSLAVGKRYFSGVSNNVRASGVVCYQIEARLYEGDRVVMSRVADIRVLSTSIEIPPPIPLDGFPDDYTCAVSKRVGSGKIKTWWSKRRRAPSTQMQLNVTISEPGALRLGHVLEHNNLACVDFVASVDLKTFALTADEANAPPEDLHVTMTWLLKTTTFVAVVPMENMPTLIETASDPYIARTSTSTPLRRAKMMWRDWTPTVDGHPTLDPVGRDSPPQCFGEAKTADGNYEARWHKEEHLHLALAETPDCSTTFFTPYVSRRHCLQLRLECRTHGSAPIQFNFRVPIQIVLTRTARANHSNNRASPSSEPTEIQHHSSTLAEHELVGSPVYSR